MNKFIALLFIVIAPNAIIAQNGKSIPGFLGSKNCISLTAQANVNPNMDFFLQLFSPSKGIQFERVTSRRGSVSFGYTNQNITIDEYSFDAFQYKDNDLFVPAWNSNGYTSYKGRISFAENHFFIAKTYYHLALGSIAPQGAYMRFKYNLHWQRWNGVWQWRYYEKKSKWQQLVQNTKHIIIWSWVWSQTLFQ